MKKYTITNTSIAGQWRCCDFEAQISCVFLKHQFNETQIFDASESKLSSPEGLAKAITEMGDWLFKNHYNIIMPPVDDNLLYRSLLGRRIAELRASRSLSQGELANICDLKSSTISRIENGRFSTGQDILSNIAKALGCRLDFVEEEFTGEMGKE